MYRGKLVMNVRMTAALRVPTRNTNCRTLTAHHIQANLVCSGIRLKCLYACTHLYRGPGVCVACEVRERHGLEIVHPKTEATFSRRLAQVAARYQLNGKVGTFSDLLMSRILNDKSHVHLLRKFQPRNHIVRSRYVDRIFDVVPVRTCLIA
jgi:hypothetical protein